MKLHNYSLNDWKKCSDETFSFPRDLRFSASWGLIQGVLKHLRLSQPCRIGAFKGGPQLVSHNSESRKSLVQPILFYYWRFLYYWRFPNYTQSNIFLILFKWNMIVWSVQTEFRLVPNQKGNCVLFIIKRILSV